MGGWKCGKKKKWPNWPAGLLNSDFEHMNIQSLAAQLQVHPSATWWITVVDFSIS